MRLFFLSLIFLANLPGPLCQVKIEAAPLAAGAAVGMDFPLAHTDRSDAGVSTEGFYRLDPYEIRFRYADNDIDYYSVHVAMKYFISDAHLRPFVEVFAGPCIVNTEGEGLAYGLSPGASLGAELALTSYLSSSVVTRYLGYLYFGETGRGSWEAQHSLAVLAGLSFWF